MVPWLIKLSERQGWLESPGGLRKIHSHPTSRLGGVGVFVSFLIALKVAQIVVGFELSPLYLLGICLVFLTGLVDDFYSISPWLKLTGQIMGALCLIEGGVLIQFFTLPLGSITYLGWLGYPLTLLWIVGITNALNLIDGMDGLSAGITAIAACALGVVAWQEGRLLPALISFVLLGAVLGFLRYNFPPARVFLGDGGALFLGSMLAVISVQGALKSTTVFTLSVPLLILGVPVFDTLFAIVRRRKKKLSILYPDQGHFHHRLLERGYSPRKVVLIFYLISGIFGAAAIVINKFVTNSTYFLLFLLLCFAFFWRWGKWLGVTEVVEEGEQLDKN